MQPDVPAPRSPSDVDGTSAFGLVFDNLLGRTAEQTWRDIVTMALLYRDVVVSDSWIFTNRGLIDLLTAPGGSASLIFRDRVLRIARRDKAGSFADLLKLFRAANNGQGLHALHNDDGYAALLDQVAADAVVSFPGARVGENYRLMADQVLQPEFLVALGVSLEGAETVGRLVAEAKARKADTASNTFVKDNICPFLSPDDAAKVMDIARAPYGLNLPMVLGTGIQGAPDYQGDRILRALRASHEVGSLLVLATGVPDLTDVFQAAMGDARARWVLTPEVMDTITAEELALARESYPSDREAYLTTLADFFRESSAVTFGALHVAMGVYLGQATQAILDARARAGTLFGEPVGGPVHIEAGLSLKVSLPDAPLMISGVGAGRSVDLAVAPDVTIIGRKLTVPDAPTAQV